MNQDLPALGNWALGFAGPGSGGSGPSRAGDTTETTSEESSAPATPLVSPLQSRGRNGSDCRLVENNLVEERKQTHASRFLGLPAVLSQLATDILSPLSGLQFPSPPRPARRPPISALQYYIYASACGALGPSLFLVCSIAWPAAGLICILAVVSHTLASPDMENGHAKYRVAVIGSGNWGSVASRLIASNTAKFPSFYDEVRMWVFEEILPTGKKLSESINEENENCKYLPGIKLGANVIADPNLESAVKDANMLVFVTPHQFVEGICKKLIGKLSPGAEAISLIKGMEVKMEGPCMISKLIADTLGINCCVLMGANIANEIAVEMFSEATVGYRKDKEVANRWAKLFTTPYFLVSVAEDIEGVELCGTLKNIVAIAAGLVDGLDMGNNTKAAIMRIGLREMRAFSKLLFPSVRDNTFFESCGVADLITTCLGGRNRRVAEAFARNGGKRSFDELEAEMLHGQKLQGVSTAREVYEVLTYRGWQELFPLLSTVHEICIGQLPPTSIVEYSEHTPNLSIIGGPTPFY